MSVILDFGPSRAASMRRPARNQRSRLTFEAANTRSGRAANAWFSHWMYRYATRTSQQMTVLCQTPDSPEPAPRTRTSCGSRTSPSPGSRRARCTCRRSSTATTACRRLNVRAIVANDHSDNEVQQNVTAPSRYVTHLRIGNAVRDLNLVPHGISVSGWSKSHNRSLRRIGSADGPLTSTPYLAADGVRSLG